MSEIRIRPAAAVTAAVQGDAAETVRVARFLSSF